MARPHVGLPTLEGDLERYAEKYDLLELRPGDSPIPKPPTLRAWRSKVPPSFVFSVVFPKVVGELKPSPALDAALEQALGVARDVEARCFVIATPPSVTPTELNKKRLAALVERIPHDAATLAWEPRGVWESDEATSRWPTSSAWCSSSTPRASPRPRGPTAYFPAARARRIDAPFAVCDRQDGRRAATPGAKRTSSSRPAARSRSPSRCARRRAQGRHREADWRRAAAARDAPRGRRRAVKGIAASFRRGRRRGAPFTPSSWRTTGDALIAGFLAAAGSRPGVLLSPVQILIAGPGVGVRAFDGRARQPGAGVRRPRGFVRGQEVPAAAHAAVPASISALALLHAHHGELSFARLADDGAAIARSMGSSEREAPDHAGRPVRPLSAPRAGPLRAILAVAGRVEGGLLSEADFGDVRPEARRSPVRSR